MTKMILYDTVDWYAQCKHYQVSTITVSIVKLLHFIKYKLYFFLYLILSKQVTRNEKTNILHCGKIRQIPVVLWCKRRWRPSSLHVGHLQPRTVTPVPTAGLGDREPVLACAHYIPVNAITYQQTHRDRAERIAFRSLATYVTRNLS